MWSISNIINNVTFTKKQAAEVAKNKKLVSHVLGYSATEEEILNELFEVKGTKYKLHFNQDHQEHMDFVAFFKNDLAALKVKGDITFGSFEGDNAGSFWGYRFDGNGGVKDLKGKVVFTEE